MDDCTPQDSGRITTSNDVINDLLDEIGRLERELAQRSGWLPISEAPRDGSYILLAGERDQDIASGYWLQSAYNGVGAWIWPFVHRNPVRYMPLPPPPITKGEPK